MKNIYPFNPVPELKEDETNCFSYLKDLPFPAFTAKEISAFSQPSAGKTNINDFFSNKEYDNFYYRYPDGSAVALVSAISDDLTYKEYQESKVSLFCRNNPVLWFPGHHFRTDNDIIEDLGFGKYKVIFGGDAPIEIPDIGKKLSGDTVKATISFDRFVSLDDENKKISMTKLDRTVDMGEKMMKQHLLLIGRYIGNDETIDLHEDISVEELRLLTMHIWLEDMRMYQIAKELLSSSFKEISE